MLITYTLCSRKISNFENLFKFHYFHSMSKGAHSLNTSTNAYQNFYYIDFTIRNNVPAQERTCLSILCTLMVVLITESYSGPDI